MKCKNCGKEIEPHDAVVQLKTGVLDEDGEEIEQVKKVEYKHVQCGDSESGFVGTNT